MKLFGYEFKKVEEFQPESVKTFTPPMQDDGAVTIQTGSYYGTYVDLDGAVRNEIELITRYREMSMQPELETAIDDIVNEAIVMEDSGTSVEINMDELKEAPEKVKKKIKEEFEYILKLLNFGNMGHEVFRRWYVDGRLNYHGVIDEAKISEGLRELRYIDPRKIRKIREIKKGRDPITGMELIKDEQEYYLYNERGVIGTHSNLGTKIAPDAIINVNSGLMDAKRSMVLSYLHKAIKPLNQLRMMEDATVVYRISRAPERRIFYVDVGNMPTIKAEQYLRDIMVKYRNKLVYDQQTGEIKDDRKHLSMLEDIWLPRREGSKGTEISTLPGGQNLGQMDDVKYFEEKLYKSLGIPVSRLQQGTGFSLGRSTEITRDELRFHKNIQKLRNKFSQLFDDALRIQLVTKKICSAEEWDEFKENIWYDFKSDNNFDELKDAELLSNRIAILQAVDPLIDRYFSIEWARKKIMHLTDDEIKEIDKQKEAETAAMNQQLLANPGAGMPGQPGQPSAPALDQSFPQAQVQPPPVPGALTEPVLPPTQAPDPTAPKPGLKEKKKDK